MNDVAPESVDAKAVSPFVAAWAAVDAAKAARAAVNNSWNQLRDEQVFYPTVETDPDGQGRIDVHCEWPYEIRQSIEDAASAFTDAIGAAFDSAILATAQLVCAAIGEPDPALHRMLCMDDRAAFRETVRGGAFPGLRPDQVRLIESFQPFTGADVDGAESAAATTIRSAMRHYANLLTVPSSPEAAFRIAVWAHSADPEIFIESPGRVISVGSTGDGVLGASRTIATYHVDGDHDLLRVRGNPNVAFDVIANRLPWPEDPDDNFGARSRLLMSIASEFIRSCERSVQLRDPLREQPSPTLRVIGADVPAWAPVRLEDGEQDLTTMMGQSDIGLATYRNVDGELVMLIQHGDTVYGRPIPPALLLDPSQGQGDAAEDATIDAASRWGLPDFVFRPRVISKGSGRRELGDATIITGSKGVAVQVKSREGAPKDDAGEARWLTKKAIEGAKQAAGTVRTLRRSPVELTNGRGRTVTCHADQITWMGVVILDHPAAPEDISPPNFEVGIPMVAMLRRDWDFLFDHLRSVSAVVDYLHRVTEATPVAIGDEPIRYFELANADEHEPPASPEAWIARAGAIQAARPILPKAPATAEDAGGHAVFRILLEDIAESDFTGPEERRLEMLAKLDRFSVSDRAELGRLLIERLEAASNVADGKTTWQHRLVVQDGGTLHLFFSVGSHMTETHRDVYQGWVLLRRHEFIELTGTEGSSTPPWTVAVLLTPRHDGIRAWDTTMIATCEDALLDRDELERLSALWNEARIQ